MPLVRTIEGLQLHDIISKTASLLSPTHDTGLSSVPTIHPTSLGLMQPFPEVSKQTPAHPYLNFHLYS